MCSTGFVSSSLLSGAFSSVSGGQRPDLPATSQIWPETAELAVVVDELDMYQWA
ncbi:hypothetical protein PF005_g14750 [Phytophthora fragariae]|uniref:Uncharacterized protein n=1 Tax=Phytophthora fragariae TaxID=53985 RepID=A0A6A4D678_9STRA|nr:hypothetical protein PF003_g8240 [Phytophthora fragariae]KAE8933583.1 hypothetical protein PF009_g16417 [Phytophthora fragariae]KAE9001476.1 hypothetical protein PF011_g13732 [Phytophthora fragariae]KAE9101293.1 hypothetical protein PF010_g14506 [Phytophthora fragariae]KAE9101636.1 hypothetical protein PF007_g15071 [Phytophthora fragariae]